MIALLLYIWVCSYFLLEIVGLAQFEQGKLLGQDMQYLWWHEEINPFATDLDVKDWILLLVFLPIVALFRAYFWITKD